MMIRLAAALRRKQHCNEDNWTISMFLLRLVCPLSSRDARSE